jgi:hypothetical protein
LKLEDDFRELRVEATGLSGKILDLYSLHSHLNSAYAWSFNGMITIAVRKNANC